MSCAIACVVGARPNFVKIGPVLEGLRRANPAIRPLLVHTGQHYDESMSDSFFRQLRLPKPDVHLDVGSGSQGQQTATTLARYEAWLLQMNPRPAATLVVGDVNSTVACALASVKLQIPVIHVEAGLRSHDRHMPEEINRIVTDAIADLLLVSEPAGLQNLRREGRPASSTRLVGNVMIDVLKQQLATARAVEQPTALGLVSGNYALWTMHRPANVDDADVLAHFVRAMQGIASLLPVVMPVHPRTRARLEEAGLWSELRCVPEITLTGPLGYHELLSLSCQSRMIITDSGGLQEEATALGIPCLTLRDTTERPITVTQGTSTLIGRDVGKLWRLVEDVLRDRYKQGSCPAVWDGDAGTRIGLEVNEFLQSRSRPEVNLSRVRTLAAT